MDYKLVFFSQGVNVTRLFSSQKMMQQFIRQHSLLSYSTFFQGREFVVVGRQPIFQSDMTYLIGKFGVQWVKLTCAQLQKEAQ